MKQLYLWIFLLFACGNLLAQSNMVQYEYWLDNDYVSKIQTTISPVQTFNWQTTIPYNGLESGVHGFHVRFKDTQGLWSPVVSSYFYKIPQQQQNGNTIAAYEYWLDDQYAGRKTENTAPSQTSDFAAVIPYNELESGMHGFHIRFKDTQGLWSPVVSSYFYKIPQQQQDGNTIAAYEYWLDDQYAGRKTENTASSPVVNFSSVIPYNELEPGMHDFHIRFKDTQGLWSPVVSSHFYKIPQQSKDDNAIVAYEYWLNNAYDQKTTVQIDPQQTFVLIDNVKCSSADKVISSISYRFLDSSGLWSSVYTENFHTSVTISVNMVYTKSVLAGETPEAEAGYPDYASVGFTLHNITKKEDITEQTVQYPNIILNQKTDAGDSISITAIGYSPTNGFEPVTDTVVVEENNIVSATFNILQRGLIRSNYLSSENEANVGILYDSAGHRLAQYDYTDRMLTTDALTDGTYYLLSMAKSLNFNTIQDLSAYASTELSENTDYILQTLEVKSGIITETTVPTIPKLDEDQLYYTASNTLFSVNKSLIALDNYVTLRGEIAFKEAYRAEVGSVKLIADIPEDCSFVDSSVMVGDSVFNDYTIQDNQLTVLLATDSAIVHFCIIPSKGGDYTPNAFVEFTLSGKTIRQPIGAAYFKAEGLKIYVPDITSNKTITAKGIVPAESLVKVYDNDEFIGQITALANGNWTMQCDLQDTSGFSIHSIHAEVTTPQSLTLQTETKDVVYDETLVIFSKVTMYNTAHRSTSLELQEYATTFDFLNPSMMPKIYWYWPNYPDFTFTIALDRNDPALVSNLQLYVLTTSGETVVLPALYDPVKGLWATVHPFSSNSLPINVKIAYEQHYNDVYEVLYGQDKAGKTVGNIVSEFTQLYKAYMTCAGNPGAIANYFAEIITLYKLDPAISTTLLYGSVSNRLGECFSDVAFRLEWFVDSALSLNDFSKMSEGDNIKNLMQLVNEALVAMLENPCGCFPWYIYTVDDVPATPVHDPSGYVYEAVPSNRLQGVTTSIYYQSNEGDVLWDASGYEQINPQITNEYGEYGWDVPQGLWKLTFEKEGYETAYVDWMPVPPPQLNINVGMVNAIAPSVVKVQGYEDGIEITFDKFMQTATMTTNFITVTRNGADEAGGTIDLLDAEENPASEGGELFVSKIRFVPRTPFLSSDEVVLTVNRMVMSYAGKNMTDDFVQRIEIEKEVKSMTATPVLNLAINEKGFIEISAEPKEAAAGKNITARSVSSVLATVTENAVLDADGKAILQVTGELPGNTQIIVTLDGTDLKVAVDVSIAMRLAETEQTAIPIASIPSGSKVDKNTEVSLSSATEGAIIHYTTDGSIPAASAGTEYTQPIVITSDVVIRAIATKEGMSDSEIAVFEFFVNDDTSIGEIASGQSGLYFVHNRTLFIRGLKPGEPYTVYSVLGNVVIHGKATNEIEQQIPLPNKGVFVFSTSKIKAKILVK